jgi:carboxypeptidase C (cathepsin A)
MKNYILLLCATLGISLNVAAQGPGDKGGGARNGGAGREESAPTSAAASAAISRLPISRSRTLLLDSAVTTKHTVTIKGKLVPYTAVAGSIPVWDEEGHAIAGVFYTYYERNDITDKERESRPLVISFNGGPGTSSLWMELGYTGPRLLNIDDEGNPIQPYGIKENPNSILDVADIVYVDPVNTGYSRMVNPEIPKSKFFGVNADIKYLAEWVSTFISRKNRWASPKFLIGESYGTTRVSGLALELQNTQWIYLNGVVLVSPTDLGIERSGPVGEALTIPYMAATAWYHGALSPDLQKKDLVNYLPEVEKFTIDELIPAIAKGGFLPPDERKAIAEKIAKYIGIKEDVVLDNNLQITTNFFWKELLRSKGYTVGRLDSRYKGIDRANAGVKPDYNAEQIAWNHAFTPAMHIYMKDELKYKTDLDYYVFGPVRPWDNSNNMAGENLRQAIAENPYMHLLIQSGYYDGACDYFNAKYSMWQLDPSGRLKDRLKWEGYRSGHMMYLRKQDAAVATENLRKFIRESTPAEGVPAKY